MWKYFTQCANWYKYYFKHAKLFMFLIENQKMTSPVRRERIKKALKHRAASTWQFWFSSTLAAFGNKLLHPTPASCPCSSHAVTHLKHQVLRYGDYLVFLAAAEWPVLLGVTAEQWAWSDKVTEKTCFVMFMVCKGSCKDYPSSQGETCGETNTLWAMSKHLYSHCQPFKPLKGQQVWDKSRAKFCMY